MAQPDGIFEDTDFEAYFEEGANWTWFKEDLALCVQEGTPGPILDIGSGLGFFVECCRKFGIRSIIILSPSKYNWKENTDPAHINLYTKETIREEVENAGFTFRKYLRDGPRTFLTHTKLEYFLMRQIYRFAKQGYLSQSAACVAVKPDRGRAFGLRSSC